MKHKHTALLLSLAVMAPSMGRAQLVDGGFEVGPLVGFGTVPGTWTTGSWGTEFGFLSTGTSGVTPFQGNQMLAVPNSGDHSSQTVQIVNVATQIANGTTAFTASAFFNTDVQGATAPTAFLSLKQYGSSPFWTGHSASNTQVLVMDSSLGSWQNISVTANMLSGTQWLTFEVAFINANLGSGLGFVDDATLTAVPEPVSMLALVPAAACLWRRRNQRKA